MYFDFSTLDVQTVYKLLTASVTPRPIAWVTSCSKDGIVNAAPFSFFNVMGRAPPVVALGLLRHEEERLNDTASNILATGEFVVNLVSHAQAEAMNVTCAPYPPDVNELECAGVTTAAAAHVTPPRIVDSPVALECTCQTSVLTGPDQLLVIGRVLAAHIRDDCILDPVRGYVDTHKLDLIARMHGAGWYAHRPQLFQMPRPVLPPAAE